VTLIPYHGDEGDRERHYIARADGYGTVVGYNALWYRVKDFYVGVCLVKQGEGYTGCNDERGRD
jgi:hypothetical protein